MKEILKTGFKVALWFGILIFLGKIVIVDFLTKLWEPLILAITGRSYLVIPLTIVFTLLVVIILGVLFSKERSRRVSKKVLGKLPIVGWIVGGERIPESIKDNPGCLVELAPGETYFIAALIKEVKLKRLSGLSDLYILYSPSAPIPWSGFPVIFAKKERVILLKISYRQVYQITASFGEGSPNLLEELAPFISTD